MKFRLAYLATITAMLSAACALLVDIPDSVSVATDSGTNSEEEDAAQACTGPIRLRLLNATDSISVADVALPFFLGANDLLREINETGGIRGCPLEFEFVQTEFTNPAKAVEIYENWKTKPEWNDVVAIFGVGSADALALGPKVTQDKKVLISTAYNGTLASPLPVKLGVDVPEVSFVEGPPTQMNETTFSQEVESKGYPYVFFPGTDYSTAMRIAMFHVSTVEPGARIGFVHCAANEFCLNPLPAGKTYAKQLGLLMGRELLAELTDRPDKYGPLVTSYFVTEASHVLSEEAQSRTYKPVSWLWAGNLTAGTAILASVIGQLQNSPNPNSAAIPDAVWEKAKEIMTSTRIIANNFGFDESLGVSFCPKLPAPNPCQKIFGVMPFLAFGDRSTGSTEMQKVVDLHDKWRARDVNESYNDAAAIIAAGLPVPTTRSVRYVQGYMNVKLLKMGIERVMDQGKPVTGENLKAALETFQSEDTGGLTAPLSFSPDDHRPQSTVSIYTLDYPTSDAGPIVGTLKNIPPTRRIALQNQWLGW
ncbi:MAG TPA: ABC transporter substrate-binding protein [Labilithrix sp.]|nr:ABC transporter substrate-binding protein [Labilithrix sp.]